MGLNSIPTRSEGETILDEFFNVLKVALGGDFVPRNASGEVTENAGNLGNETYPWKRANITAGYWVAGDVKMFHDFNGELSPGQGWMKCNGDVVNEENYDAIHGEGSWAEFIVTSPLEGKNLPNMNNRFPVGTEDTSQDGSEAITYEGQPDHEVQTSNHTHTAPSHTHQWYAAGGSTLTDSTFTSVGVGTSISASSVNKSDGAHIEVGFSGGNAPGNSYTSPAGGTATSSNGGETLSIKPESCAFEFWMRII